MLVPAASPHIGCADVRLALGPLVTFSNSLLSVSNFVIRIEIMLGLVAKVVLAFIMVGIFGVALRI